MSETPMEITPFSHLPVTSKQCFHGVEMWSGSCITSEGVQDIRILRIVGHEFHSSEGHDDLSIHEVLMAPEDVIHFVMAGLSVLDRSEVLRTLLMCIARMEAAETPSASSHPFDVDRSPNRWT
jgi:hypothetical protein